MVDWDTVVLGPLQGVFGERVRYWPSADSPISSARELDITATFDGAYQEAGNLAELGVISTRPVLGVQLSQFPAAFDPEQAQKDRFMVVRTGAIYIVKSGHPDSHGHARLDAMLSP